MGTAAKKVFGLACGSVPITHQASKIEMKLQRGEYFQMDGEPWVLNVGCTAVVEPNVRVCMLCPVESGHGGGVWDGKQKRTFWEAQMQENYGFYQTMTEAVEEMAMSTQTIAAM